MFKQTSIAVLRPIITVLTFVLIVFVISLVDLYLLGQTSGLLSKDSISNNVVIFTIAAGTVSGLIAVAFGVVSFFVHREAAHMRDAVERMTRVLRSVIAAEDENRNSYRRNIASFEENILGELHRSSRYEHGVLERIEQRVERTLKVLQAEQEKREVAQYATKAGLLEIRNARIATLTLASAARVMSTEIPFVEISEVAVDDGTDFDDANTDDDDLYSYSAAAKALGMRDKNFF